MGVSRTVLNNTKKSAPSPHHFLLTMELNRMRLKSPMNLIRISLFDLANTIPHTGYTDFLRHLLCVHWESSFSSRNWKYRVVLNMIECLLNCYKRKIDFPFPALSLIINQFLFTGIFPDSLKTAEILPISKKGILLIVGTTGPYLFFQLYQRYLKMVLLFKYLNTLIRIICCKKSVSVSC